MQQCHLFLGFRMRGGATAGGLGVCAGSFWKEMGVQATEVGQTFQVGRWQTEGSRTWRNLNFKETTWVPTRSLTEHPPRGRPRGGGCDSPQARPTRPSRPMVGPHVPVLHSRARSADVRAAHGAVWGAFILTARGTRAARRASICSGEGRPSARLDLVSAPGWTRARRRRRAAAPGAGPPVHAGRAGFPGTRG